MMSSSSSSSVANRAWIAAAGVGVQELEDQVGICRWNHTIRLMQQHTKNNLRSYSQGHHKLSSSCSALFSRKLRDDKPKHSEESMRNVMYLNSWGPN